MHCMCLVRNVEKILFILILKNDSQGGPQGGLKSRFHAGFSDKSRPEIAWNSCSRQVYPITLDARLIIHAITQLFSPNSRFHAMKYVQSRHHAFPLGGPLRHNSIKSLLYGWNHREIAYQFSISFPPSDLTWTSFLMFEKFLCLLLTLTFLRVGVISVLVLKQKRIKNHRLIVVG